MERLLSSRYYVVKPGLVQTQRKEVCLLNHTGTYLVSVFNQRTKRISLPLSTLVSVGRRVIDQLDGTNQSGGDTCSMSPTRTRCSPLINCLLYEPFVCSIL